MYEKCRNCEYICTCCLSGKYYDCCSGCENDHDEFKPTKNIRFCPLDGNKIECEGVLNMTIGERIRLLREENNLYQGDISRLLGICQQTLSKYENGGLDIPATALTVLAIFYNVSLDWLFGLSSNREPKFDIDINNKFISEILEMREKIMSNHSKKRPRIGRHKKTNLDSVKGSIKMERINIPMTYDYKGSCNCNLLLIHNADGTIDIFNDYNELMQSFTNGKSLAIFIKELADGKYA